MLTWLWKRVHLFLPSIFSFLQRIVKKNLFSYSFCLLLICGFFNDTQVPGWPCHSKIPSNPVYCMWLQKKKLEIDNPIWGKKKTASASTHNRSDTLLLKIFKGGRVPSFDRYPLPLPLLILSHPLHAVFWDKSKVPEDCWTIQQGQLNSLMCSVHKAVEPGAHSWNSGAGERRERHAIVLGDHIAESWDRWVCIY